MKHLAFFLVMVTCCAISWAADPPDTLHYTGVLRDADDLPIDGSVSMVFRFFDVDALAGGDEILVDSHASVLVTMGLFDVALGSGLVSDGTGPGVYESLLDVFRHYQGVWLEIQVNGETLTPRVPIASSAYALNARTVRGHEVTTGGPLDLYVDASQPDDSEDGLSPFTAKSTIQAALDLIPTIVHHDVVVHVTPGTYTESLLLKDRLAPGGASITLQREPATDWVFVSGTGTKARCLELSGVSNVYIEGFSFSDATSTGASVNDAADITFHQVEFRDNYVGLLTVRSNVVLDVVTIANNTTSGLNCTSSSRCQVSQLTASGNVYGVYAARAAQVRFQGPASLTSNGYGAAADEAATVDLVYRSDITVTGNTLASLLAREHGRMLHYGSAVITSPACTSMTYGLCTP